MASVSRFRTSAFCLLPFALFLSSACAAEPGRPPVVRLAVEGRDNATPSVAARDRLVVVTWSASVPEGGTDIFAAVSHDGGADVPRARAGERSSWRGARERRTAASRRDRTCPEQSRRACPEQSRRACPEQSRRACPEQSRRARPEQSRRAARDRRRSGQPGGTARQKCGSRDRPTAAALRRICGGPFRRARWPARVDVARDRRRQRAARRVAGWPQCHAKTRRARCASATPAAPASGHKHHGAGGGDSRQDLYYSVFRADGTRTETQVATHVCFCCKTAVVTDGSGHASIAWRHIFPNDLRDIAFRTLGESATSGEAVRISEDQWQLKGCPDDGPAMVREPWRTRPSRVADDGSRRTSCEGRVLRVNGRRTDVLAARAARRRRRRLGVAPAAGPDWIERARRGLGRAAGQRPTRYLIRRRSPDGQWSPIEVLPDSATAYYPAVAAVSDATIVVWASATTPRQTIGVMRR